MRPFLLTPQCSLQGPLQGPARTLLLWAGGMGTGQRPAGCPPPGRPLSWGLDGAVALEDLGVGAFSQATPLLAGPSSPLIPTNWTLGRWRTLYFSEFSLCVFVPVSATDFQEPLLTPESPQSQQLPRLSEDAPGSSGLSFPLRPHQLSPRFLSMDLTVEAVLPAPSRSQAESRRFAGTRRQQLRSAPREHPPPTSFCTRGCPASWGRQGRALKLTPFSAPA